MTPLPWDELADALDEAQEAMRADDGDRHRMALDEVNRCREACGHLGGMLILLALQYAGLPVQKRLSEAFGEMSAAAWDRATKAGKRATWAVDEIRILQDRVRVLEAKLERYDAPARRAA